MNDVNRENVKNRFFELERGFRHFPEVRAEVFAALRLSEVVNSSAASHPPIDPIFAHLALRSDQGRRWERISLEYQKMMFEVQGLATVASLLEEAALARRMLSVPFLLQLHRTIFERTQYSIAGKFRSSDGRTSPTGHENPRHSTLPELLEHHLFWLTHRLNFIGTVTSATFFEVFHIAAETQYRFIESAPFEDGNGRMARALGNYVLLFCGLYYCIIRQEDREAYYESLRQSTIESLSPSVDFLVSSLSRTLEQIAGVVHEAHKQHENGLRERLS